jgi:hypothetical protein
MTAGLAKLASADFLRNHLDSLLTGLKNLSDSGCAPFLKIESLPNQ